MPNKPTITLTKELKFPRVKEDFVEEKLKRALDDLCWQCSCDGGECADCVLELENFKQLGRRL